jgi:thymidylate kinase
MSLDASYALVVSALRALSRKPPIRVFFEGNVGAGKSTAIAEVKRALESRGFRVCVFVEQIERWSHQRLLRDLYSGGLAGKRAFEALGPLRDFVERQHFVSSRSGDYDYVLFERHPTTTLRVFGAGDDDATRGLYAVVNAAFPFMDPPEHTVYVRVSPNACISRIKSRGRAEESSLDVAFLEDLAAKHDREMVRREREGLSVVSVDGETKSPHEVAKATCAALRVPGF